VSLDTSRPLDRPRPPGAVWLGSLGHVLLLVWMLSLVLLVPATRIWLSAGICLVVAVALYPVSFRRLLRWRILLLLGMILLASLFFGGVQPDSRLFGIPFSIVGLVGGLQMVVRAVVILVAVDGFSAAVEIGEVAGMVERLGLRGLGFSIGVAFNLLPALRQAGLNTWHSMWMRGGLRKRRLRSLRLMLVTIITNALRRGDEIALAAEARAFTPERSRLIPLRRGRLDSWLALPLLAVLLAVLFIPGGWGL
jgi:energy-coupling factor transport system permease protein